MMIVKGVDKVFASVNGTALLAQDGSPFTLRRGMADALLGAPGDDKGQEKYERYRIARMVLERDDGELELTSEEISKVKDLAGRAFGPWVVGLIWDALEGKDLPDVIKDPDEDSV